MILPDSPSKVSKIVYKSNLCIAALKALGFILFTSSGILLKILGLHLAGSLRYLQWSKSWCWSFTTKLSRLLYTCLALSFVYTDGNVSIFDSLEYVLKLCRLVESEDHSNCFFVQ